MLYRLTRALDGLIDDLPTTGDPGEARVVLLGSQPLDLARFPRLRGIFRAGAGTDNVPPDAAARGIAVGLPSPASLEILYDEAAAFTCHLVLRLAYADAAPASGWERRPRRALRDKTALVVGAGRIGVRVARRLAPLMTVETFDARRPRADGAGLVNISRGPLVDEQALLAEIRSGRLRAAFDVFWQEPYDGPLAAFPPDQFLMTPHVAGACREFLAAAAGDLRRFLDRFGPSA